MSRVQLEPAQASSGRYLVGARVLGVTHEPTGLPVTLYTTPDGSTEVTYPLVSDIEGAFEGYAEQKGTHLVLYHAADDVLHNPARWECFSGEDIADAVTSIENIPDPLRDGTHRSKVTNYFTNPVAGVDLDGWQGDIGSGFDTANVDRIVDGDLTSVEITGTDDDAAIRAGSPAIDFGVASDNQAVIHVSAEIEAITLDAGAEILLSMSEHDEAGAFVGDHDIAWITPADAEPVLIEGMATMTFDGLIAVTVTPVGNTGPVQFRVTKVMVCVDPPEGSNYVDGEQGTYASWLGADHASRSVGYIDQRPSEDFHYGTPALEFAAGQFSEGVEAGGTAIRAVAAISLHKRLGLNAVRVGVSIGSIQPEEVDDYDFSFWDPYFDYLRDADIKAVVMFGIGAFWMTPSVSEATWNAGAYPPDPAYRPAYAAGCVAFCERYEDCLLAAELWNEPNLSQFWTPGVDPVDFMAFYTPLQAALKAALPDLDVIGGALAAQQTDTSGHMNMLDFLQGMYDEGFAAINDGLALHPYPWGSTTINGPPAKDGGQIMGYARALRQMRQVRDANGDSDKPMWFTEIGVSTTGDTNWTAPVNERQQAQALRLFSQMAERAPDIAGIFFHREVDTQTGAFSEGYGVFRNNGWSPKPAAYALRELWQPDVLDGPLFEAVELAGNWSNLEANWGHLGFRVLGDQVQIKGVIARSPVTPTTQEVIFTLPEGMRPADRQILTTFGGDDLPVRLTVDPDGEVHWVAGGDGTYLAFDHTLALGGVRGWEDD